MTFYNARIITVFFLAPDILSSYSKFNPLGISIKSFKSSPSSVKFFYLNPAFPYIQTHVSSLLKIFEMTIISNIISLVFKISFSHIELAITILSFEI